MLNYIPIVINNLRFYLSAYNFLAMAMWLLFFIQFLSAGCSLNATGVLLLNVAQGIAILEIVHALLKWVKSPLASTAAQVISRLFVLLLINLFIHHNPLLQWTRTGIVIVAFAWSITEIVRYSFYLLLLYKHEPEWLLWMRYSFFILLYPLGVSGEWMIFLTPIFEQGISLNLYSIVIGGTLLAYLYYFPVLYGYMWKQRKQKL